MPWPASWFRRRRCFDDLSVSIETHIAENDNELVESGAPATLALVLVVLMAAAASASLGPALMAISVDPTKALQAE